MRRLVPLRDIIQDQEEMGENIDDLFIDLDDIAVVPPEPDQESED